MGFALEDPRDFSDLGRLIEAASRGQRAAMEALLERYEPLLRAAVRGHLGPGRFQNEGEDLLQMLRLTIIEALPSLRTHEPCSFEAWLKKVVRNRLLDWEKHQRARRRHPSKPILRLRTTNAAEVAGLGTTPSRIVSRREDHQRLRRAIELVPERYRGLLRLMYEKDPSPAEVAEFLEKPPEAARKFTARALDHLQRVLTKLK
jgi:RNA polymerase sigma factor (sigma-70 family)